VKAHVLVRRFALASKLHRSSLCGCGEAGAFRRMTALAMLDRSREAMIRYAREHRRCQLRWRFVRGDAAHAIQAGWRCQIGRWTAEVTRDESPLAWESFVFDAAPLPEFPHVNGVLRWAFRSWSAADAMLMAERAIAEELEAR